MEMLVSVFSDKDMAKLKEFIITQASEAKDYNTLAKVMYSMWIVAQSRVSKLS